MRNNIESFRGEAPRLTPRALPPNGAQDATNARLLSGDLEAWRQFALEQVLDNTGPVLSIYRLGSIWLAWDADVDVARGALAGDASLRIFLTGPGAYDRPRWTNLALAGAGNGPPAETRPLGVPSPEGAPSVAAGIDPTPSSFAIDILDEGNVLATSWSTSPAVNQATFNSNVVQDAVNGNPAPSYQMSWRDYETGTYLKRNFGIGSANSVSMGFDWWVNTTSGRSRFWAGVQRNEAGEGVSVQLDQVSADSWVLSIGTGSSWNQGQNQNTLISSAAVNTLTSDTWMRMFITVVTNLDTTTTVTATVRDIGDTDLVSVTTQVATPAGDFCGFGSGFDQLGETSVARFDNIHVQAAGSTGYNPVNTATSYVYTYVNDQSEESAPSFASETVLRPAGIAITVTTPTDIPTGLDSSWHIETKRIYRSVVGSTGTVFRFVAEIPLAQLDYVDSIPDTELGDALESEGWALPPVNLRNILALPNGTMAGIAGNQLCLSAQNRPHAWPLANRYTVDTDAVAIGNIDTTVVIGTEAFPYLAIGTSPGDYSMTKLEVPQACVSKRSLAYLTGFGVIFASPDGLIAVAGNGNVQNLTGGVFTRKQWQALVPESIVGAAHDDVYHFFYDTDEVESLLWLDTFDGTVGTLLDAHAQTVPLTGSIWQTFSENYIPALSGSGDVGKYGGVAVFGPMGAITFFNLVPFLPGWVLEVDLTPLQTVTADPGAQAYSEIRVSSSGEYVVVRFIPESPSEDAALYFDFQGAADFVTYPLPEGLISLSVLVELAGCTLTINGVAQAQVPNTLGVNGIPLTLYSVQMVLGIETSGDEPRPSASAQLLRISGQSAA